jgi:hypothetical protein
VLPKGLPTAACLRGLPTVFAVNEQLQEETLDVLYGDVTVETTMGPDYSVPCHWKCPRRLIDLTRLTKILFPIHLDPLCPTKSDFPPLLIAAQNHGLNTRTQESHLAVLQWMLNSNQLSHLTYHGATKSPKPADLDLGYHREGGYYQSGK